MVVRVEGLSEFGMSFQVVSAHSRAEVERIIRWGPLYDRLTYKDT